MVVFLCKNLGALSKLCAKFFYYLGFFAGSLICMLLQQTVLMLKVAVYFDKSGQYGYPLNERDYLIAYHEFQEELAKLGAEMFMVRTQETYKGGNTFSEGWKYGGDDLTVIPVKEEITVDVIFNKGNLVTDTTANVINVPELERLCTDKSQTYTLFSAYAPKTKLVHAASELQQACSSVTTQYVVAKPLDKEGGEGVIIATPEEVLQSIQSFPYLIQEFIDTSNGIPGMMKGIHDLRIANVNGHITHSYYRTPPQGKLLANVAQGGEMHFLTENEIPADALGLFRAIDDVMKKYSERIYSVDMGRNSDGRWMIIEMNSKPGLLPKKNYAHMAEFQKLVAELLVRVARAYS